MKRLMLFASVTIGISLSASAQSNCGGFTTYTIGGWGTSCAGNNPGCYRDAHFADAFPAGLTIGCNNTLTLTSSLAVDNFMPSGGTPAALPEGNLNNPTGSYKNVLAAQLVGVTLALGFDASDANFSTSSLALGDLFITQGAFNGWTVTAFMTEANNAIGGCGSAFSFADINATATSINENFDNGTANNGFLICKKLEVFLDLGPAVLCNGDNSSIISSEVKDGVAPFTYLWSNGATTASISNVGAGTYTLTVTDAAGQTAQATATIAEPPAIEITASQINVLCFGASTGSASVSIVGGVAPYDVVWNTGATTETISDLSAGTYVAFIVDENGCKDSALVVIEEPTALLVSSTQADILCFGANTGAASLNIEGGVAPYTIEWSNGATSENIEGLVAGTYFATVTDSNGCAASDSVTITEPTQVTVSSSQTDVLCFGANTGSASLTINGGVAPYTIAWSNGASTESINGLLAGTYSAIVTDANGCVSSDSVTITEPTLLEVSSTQTNVLCFGGNTGSATLSIVGGVSPYTIEWSNGASTENISQLTAGVYTLVVRDANSCFVEDTIEISEPTALTLVATSTDAICYGGTGTATATVSGGTAPYSYSWTGTYETTATVNLPVGNWTVSVTDANNCPAVGAISISLLSCNGFKTFTQGGWGTKCSGGNPGCYRDANFAAAFPYGLTIGACGRFITLTNSAATKAFLPNSGTPKALNAGTLVNPTSTSYKNTLAGQVVALTLSVTFDETDAAFSPSTTTLRNLIISSGTFAGWSVGQLLDEANKALGGCSSYAASDLNAAVDAINRNYDNGTSNLNYLACPCTPTSQGRFAFDNLLETENATETATLNASPNPTNGSAAIEFTVNYNTSASVELFNNSNGQFIGTLYSGAVNADQEYSVMLNTESLNSGIYVVKLITDTNVTTRQVVVLK